MNKFNNYQSDAALYDVATDNESVSVKGNILVQESGVLKIKRNIVNLVIVFEHNYMKNFLLLTHLSRDVTHVCVQYPPTINLIILPFYTLIIVYKHLNFP